MSGPCSLVLHILSKTLMWHHTAYLSNGWAMLDCVCVITSLYGGAVQVDPRFTPG